MPALSLLPTRDIKRAPHVNDTSLLCMLSTMACIISGQGIESMLARRVAEFEAGTLPGGMWPKRQGMAPKEDLTLEIKALKEARDGVPLKTSKAFQLLRGWMDDCLNMYAQRSAFR